jgi:hypothetical protein
MEASIQFVYPSTTYKIIRGSYFISNRTGM